VRSGLRLMLRSAPDIDVVGEAADGAAAITAAAELVPDVVLMDIRMPGTDGVTATAAITAATAARVVALTTFDADELVRQATNAEIARQLYVSGATVKATVSRILAKLGLDNRAPVRARGRPFRSRCRPAGRGTASPRRSRP
jgi:DNA-binding NarL/FixJ family response regulator